MKSPSKNMSTSISKQSVAGRTPAPVSVSKQRPLSAAGMTIPGEGCVSPAPGRVDAGSAQRFANANGRRYGGGG